VREIQTLQLLLRQSLIVNRLLRPMPTHLILRLEMVVWVVRSFPSPPGVSSRVVRENERAVGRFKNIRIK
jgi:hypothetical protein